MPGQIFAPAISAFPTSLWVSSIFRRNEQGRESSRPGREGKTIKSRIVFIESKLTMHRYPQGKQSRAAFFAYFFSL